MDREKNGYKVQLIFTEKQSILDLLVEMLLQEIRTFDFD